MTATHPQSTPPLPTPENEPVSASLPEGVQTPTPLEIPEYPHFAYWVEIRADTTFLARATRKSFLTWAETALTREPWQIVKAPFPHLQKPPTPVRRYEKAVGDQVVEWLKSRRGLEEYAERHPGKGNKSELRACAIDMIVLHHYSFFAEVVPELVKWAPCVQENGLIVANNMNATDQTPGAHRAVHDAVARLANTRSRSANYGPIAVAATTRPLEHA